MRTLAVLFVLTASTAAAQTASTSSSQPAPKASMLIWDGGATREAAESTLDAWGVFAAAIPDQLELAKGYPRVVESKTVPGLKPGFWIAVIGVCAPGSEAKPLEVLKSLEPKIYLREVEWAEPLACPAKGESWEWPKVAHVKSQGRELTVVAFEGLETQPGGEFEERFWMAVAVLRDARSRQLDQKKTSSKNVSFAQIKAVEERANGVLIRGEWASPGCYGAESTDVYRSTSLFKIAGDKIVLDENDEQLKTVNCGKYYP